MTKFIAAHSSVISNGVDIRRSSMDSRMCMQIFGISSPCLPVRLQTVRVFGVFLFLPPFHNRAHGIPPSQLLSGLLACLLETDDVTDKLSTLGRDTVVMSIAVISVNIQGAHMAGGYHHQGLLLPRPPRVLSSVPASALLGCTSYYISVKMITR